MQPLADLAEASAPDVSLVDAFTLTVPSAPMAPAPPPRAHLLAVFGRHQVGGFLATLIDFSTMTVVVSVLGGNAEVGTVVGSAFGAVTNFTLGRYWVFGTTTERTLGQAGRYAVVSATSLILNTIGEYLIHERVGVQYQLARVLVAVMVSMLWNFPMQRHFVFPRAPAPTQARGSGPRPTA